MIIALWTDPGSRARAAAGGLGRRRLRVLRGFGLGCYAVDIDRFRRSGDAAEEEVARVRRVSAARRGRRRVDR